MHIRGRLQTNVRWNDSNIDATSDNTPMKLERDLPGIVGPCCHGDDEAQVYAELCDIVDEWIDILNRDGKPLPPPKAGQNVAVKIA